MKKFKDFVKVKKSKTSRIPQPHEMYVAVIHHGSHSRVSNSKSNSKSSTKKKKITEQSVILWEGADYDDIYDLFDNLTDNAHGIKDVNTEDLMNNLASHPSVDTSNNPFASDSFGNYTSSSRRMNDLLHKHHLKETYGDDGYHPDMLKNILVQGRTNLPRLDSAVHNGSAPHDLTVFSGLGWKPPPVNNGKPNNIFLPAFTSTSLNAGIAEGFMHPMNEKEKEDDDNHFGFVKSHHMAKFNIPSGTPIGVPGHQFSVNSHEHEVILPRGLITEWGEPKMIKVNDFFGPVKIKKRFYIHPVTIKDVTVHPRNFKPT